jgi:hypothetical protein
MRNGFNAFCTADMRRSRGEQSPDLTPLLRKNQSANDGCDGCDGCERDEGNIRPDAGEKAPPVRQTERVRKRGNAEGGI